MQRVKRRFFGILLLLCGVAQASDEAFTLFEQMRDALHTQDYEGRFVYQVGQNLEAMYIVHRVSGDAELERLVALDGESKQVIRGGGAVACLAPGKHRMSVIEGSPLGALRPQRQGDSEALRKLYDFELGEDHRIAGRLARVVRIKPRDSLRYGFELYLDKLTALPLRSVVHDPQGRVKSQTLFVELKTGEQVTPIERDVSALQLTESARITVPAGVTSPEQAAWTFRGLPNGFEVRSYRDEPARSRQHFILSDGLAVMSVYIEPAESGALNGFSNLGAAHLYGEQRHGHQITVVGEMPATTLRMAAQAIAPR